MLEKIEARIKGFLAYEWDFLVLIATLIIAGLFYLGATLLLHSLSKKCKDNA